MSDDPFDVLGLPARFDTEPMAVEQAYLKRVAFNHPDLVSGDDAVGKAAKLNDARLTLLDPEQRARILLNRLGYSAINELLPDGFLAEIMDVRSQLEQAAQAQNAEEIQNLERWATSQRQDYIAGVTGLFEKFELAPHEQRVDIASELRLTLNAWRYIERMLEQAGADRA